MRGATPFAHEHGPPQRHSRCVRLPGRLRLFAAMHLFGPSRVCRLRPSGASAACSQPARSASAVSQRAVSQRGQPVHCPSVFGSNASLCALIRSILTLRACFVQGSSSSSCPELRTSRSGAHRADTCGEHGARAPPRTIPRIPAFVQVGVAGGGGHHGYSLGAACVRDMNVDKPARTALGPPSADACHDHV